MMSFEHKNSEFNLHHINEMSKKIQQCQRLLTAPESGIFMSKTMDQVHPV